MTTSVPDYLAWPLLALMGIVVVLRYWFYNSSQYETYMNNTFALMVLSNLLRDRTIETFLDSRTAVTVTTAQQLSLVVMIFAAAEFMGFITLWSRISAEETRRRQRRRRLAALILSIGFLLAAARARAAGQLLEVTEGWDVVLAWTLFLLMVTALSAMLLWMSVKEGLRRDAKQQERLVAVGGAVLALSIGSTSVSAELLAIFQQLGWVDSIDYRLTAHGFVIFVETVGGGLLVSIPFALALASAAGLDQTSRHWRRLQPFRDSMTAAVPESAFDLKVHTTGRRKTTLDLHQTAVQIRDAILLLRPYFRDLDTDTEAQFVADHSVPSGERAAAVEALKLALAVRAKSLGVAPIPLDAALVVSSRSTTLEQETAELLHLAKWWPHALAFTDTHIRQHSE